MTDIALTHLKTWRERFRNASVGDKFGMVALSIFAGLRSLFAPLVKMTARWFIISLLILGAAWVFLPRAQPLEENTKLFISIDRPLAETTPFDHIPYLQFLLRPPSLSATTITDAIHKAVADENIVEIVLSIDGVAPSDSGPAQRVGEALRKASMMGKRVTVYASNFDNAKYLLAANADSILMHPMGRFDVGGVKTGAVYFGDALKKHGIDVVVGQAGTYKNAIEPYTRGSMSGPAKEAITTVLDRQLDAIATGLAEKRNLDKSALFVAISNGREEGVVPAEEAIALGLLDGTSSAPGFMDIAFGAPGDHDAAPFVALSRYINIKTDDFCKAEWEAKGVKQKSGHPTLGVITVEGEIRTGFTSEDIAGSTSIVSQIEGFVRSETNRGLLVRIDSPGGDAQASEMIRSSLERYRQLGRPVYVSMGGAAASGGYWIATAGDKIFAEDTTITGSIGVFAMRASAANLLKQYDIAWDGVAVGRHNPFGALAEGASKVEQDALKEDVTRIYRQFIDIVAAARGLDPSTYTDWAEGRVWHASDALVLGLIDEIGGYETALEGLSTRAATPGACLQSARPVTSPQSVLSSFSPMSGLSETIEAIQWAVAPRAAIIDKVTSLPSAHALIHNETNIQALCLHCEVE
ncbi:MAG: S49 family peptidase [Pseudomonadota bacterium]